LVASSSICGRFNRTAVARASVVLPAGCSDNRDTHFGIRTVCLSSAQHDRPRSPVAFVATELFG
jgi:hypothetical protein